MSVVGLHQQSVGLVVVALSTPVAIRLPKRIWKVADNFECFFPSPPQNVSELERLGGEISFSGEISPALW